MDSTMDSTCEHGTNRSTRRFLAFCKGRAVETRTIKTDNNGGGFSVRLCRQHASRIDTPPAGVRP